MPTTIKVSDHEANLISIGRSQNHAKAILDAIEPKNKVKELIQSSFGNDPPQSFTAHANGFVQTMVDSYNKHHHVIIRPDDIWLAIMTQFSCYVGAHAEELRKQFVAHEGKKLLEIKYMKASRFQVDFADFAIKINNLLEKNIVDPELRAWIVPTFSTTTQADTIVSSIVMMGTLQHYFRYRSCITCGIPSVKLLGEKSDYEDILGRLDKLEQYGDEPTQFGQLLRPILTRIIRSMDEPDSPDVIDFWRNICVVRNGSGFQTYNGWITAFCFWDKEGRAQLTSQSELKQKLSSNMRRRTGRETLYLDDVCYGQIYSQGVPAAYVKLPVEINDHGQEIEAEMISGSVGIRCTSSGRVSAGENGSVGVDTMQPHSAWFIYEVSS
ncbi:hypothetical protein F5Y10DRAFT_66447 [Nemania abortiva]|nr:hypothetical protein F5Y10DRAFT_66447 [Nemania abortiva]